MTAPGPDGPGHGDDTVSFTLRRSHAWGLGGLAVGLISGWFLNQTIHDRRAEAAGAAALPPAAAAAQPDPNRRVQVATEGRPSRGPADAPVTIVEFTDYLCPFCRQHSQTVLPALRERFGDQIRYVVRNFPIAQLHPRAPYSAVAAECAFDQGRFWEYHDALFAEPVHDDATLRRLARATGLDAARFDRCLETTATGARVDQDVRDGVAAGVTGTPAFFVNGRPIEGLLPLETFAQLIEGELRR